MDGTLTAELLSNKEVAALLGVHPRTLKGWNADGYGPGHFYIGKRLVYRRSTVEAWLLELESQGTKSSHTKEAK